LLQVRKGESEVRIEVRHLIAGILLGFLMGAGLAGYVTANDKRDAMQSGYTHGYIDGKQGTHDPAFWHHVTFSVRLQQGDAILYEKGQVLSGGGFGTSQTIYPFTDQH
jgi:hypothetical protein